MKQIEECLGRFFSGKPALAKKWRAYYNIAKSTPTLLLMHYHHIILEYDFYNEIVLHSWWEKNADKRGLDAALHYLKNREQKLPVQALHKG